MDRAAGSVLGFVFGGMVLGVGAVLATLPRRGAGGAAESAGRRCLVPDGTRGALERRARFWAGFMNRLAGAPRLAARRAPLQPGCLAMRRGYGGRCPHPLKGFIP